MGARRSDAAFGEGGDERGSKAARSRAGERIPVHTTIAESVIRHPLRAIGIAAALSVIIGGCADNPSTGSPAYKEGELGNGAFLFECDDSVACDRWTTNNAKDFPSQIATGSVFNLRFVTNDDKGHSGTFRIHDQEYTGVTAVPIGPYVSSGPDGFAAVSPGYGTVVARDHKGSIIDYASLKIVKPDGLVIYRAEYKGNDPDRIQATTIGLNQSQSFRTVGEFGGEAVAGSIRIQWESANPSIAQVESYTRGVVKVVGRSPGKTRLKAVGAALEKEIDVEEK
jgi:hypothetical protein